MVDREFGYIGRIRNLRNPCALKKVSTPKYAPKFTNKIKLHMGSWGRRMYPRQVHSRRALARSTAAITKCRNDCAGREENMQYPNIWHSVLLARGINALPSPTGGESKAHVGVFMNCPTACWQRENKLCMWITYNCFFLIGMHPALKSVCSWIPRPKGSPLAYRGWGGSKPQTRVSNYIPFLNWNLMCVSNSDEIKEPSSNACTYACISFT